MRHSQRSYRIWALLLAGCLIGPSPLHGWGRAGHFWIAERAADSVSPPLVELLEPHRSELVRLSVAADDRRSQDPDEGRRHYLDLDNYGPFPYRGFSLNRPALEAVWGADWVRSQGTVLWTIERRYLELVEAFRSRKIGAIRTAASDLCHYVSDLHQPFHASRNHDGQLSGQDGIHSRFESDLVEEMIPQLRFEPAPLRRYGRLLPAMLNVALDSLQWVDNILTADARIVEELTIARDRYRDVPRPQRRFPTPYYTRLGAAVGFVAEQRMSAAAVSVASLWQQAWEEAGRPEF